MVLWLGRGRATCGVAGLEPLPGGVSGVGPYSCDGHRLFDCAFREFGGAPTYALTDNEKTVTTSHVAGIPVRNPQMVEAARHYGITVKTCVPYDPETKGGVEATVRIAKADLVGRQTLQVIG